MGDASELDYNDLAAYFVDGITWSILMSIATEAPQEALLPSSRTGLRQTAISSRTSRAKSTSCTGWHQKTWNRGHRWALKPPGQCRTWVTLG